MTSPIDTIKKLQGNWASKREISIDSYGYTTSLNDNLFLSPSDASQKEYDAGGGDELAWKMWSLHSSSALVCNFFEYWRDRLDKTALTNALGLPNAIHTLRFEETFPTGLGGKPPHLDVTLSGIGMKPYAIEAKFTEQYSLKRPTFRASYFPETGFGLWEKHGLHSCETLAKALRDEPEQRSFLDVAQLLKHILGLAARFHSDFTLLYLWYEQPSSEADRHREEIERFKQRIMGEVDFRAMTYNELFAALSNNSGAGEDYLSYLRERYFAN